MDEKIDPRRNIVKPTSKIISKMIKEFDRYNDKRYHMKRGKKNGVWVWKWVMWKRARQIEYFKRRRWLLKNGR